MHIVTKILAVLAAVLAILLSALAIAFSTNADRIVSEFREMEATNRALDAELGGAQAQVAAARSAADQELQALEDQIRQFENEKTTLQRDNGRLLADAKLAEANVLTVQARIDQLSATAQTQAALVENMYQELTSLRDNELRYAQQEIQWSERVNDLSGQLEVALETNRALQERLVELQNQIASRGGSVSDLDRPSARTARDLQARVTNVVRDRSSGALMAEIDAGQSDRVSAGMELMIVRDGQFVANMTVERVDLNESVGRIRTLGRDVEIRRGDLVLTLRP